MCHILRIMELWVRTCSNPLSKYESIYVVSYAYCVMSDHKRDRILLEIKQATWVRVNVNTYQNWGFVIDWRRKMKIKGREQLGRILKFYFGACTVSPYNLDPHVV